MPCVLSLTADPLSLCGLAGQALQVRKEQSVACIRLGAPSMLWSLKLSPLNFQGAAGRNELHIADDSMPSGLVPTCVEACVKSLQA